MKNDEILNNNKNNCDVKDILQKEIGNRSVIKNKLHKEAENSFEP